jgi:predicted Rossmann fold flavoprotein
MQACDVIIIGAGAAGLMCAIEAGKRGRKVIVLDHAAKPAEKIRISGGGRCNFTNLHATHENFLSQNPKFCMSALKRYTQRDFIALVKKHGIKFHEKTLGQLFCDESSQQIIDMLLDECSRAKVQIRLSTKIENVERSESGFTIITNNSQYNCTSLVVACGGKSIPKMGATGYGYDIAQKFGLNIIPTEPALVPFTFEGERLKYCQSLAGIAVDAIVTCNKKQFKEAILFTHRGISGPAILQISSYWQKGAQVTINLAPSVNAFEFLKSERSQNPKQEILTALAKILPKRLAQQKCEDNKCSGKLADINNKTLEAIANSINQWRIIPDGTEGYRTAEVTIGGVDTADLSSKTMEAKKVPGLYFIGEVVDVTGHLGGFNFQWAWSSGFAAGQFV